MHVVDAGTRIAQAAGAVIGRRFVGAPQFGSDPPRTMLDLASSLRHDPYAATVLVALVAACGPPPDRHTYGDPDLLPGIDIDGGGEPDDADTDAPEPEPPPPSDDGAAGDDGPPDSGPMGDDGSADDGHADGGSDGGVPQDPPTSPYIGGWDIGNCQDSIVATGTGVGQVVPDFVLTDQNGDQVRLYDFCHKAVFLTAGAFW